MKLETVIKRLTREYNKVKDKQHIRRPISYALYQTWLFVNMYEKERTTCVHEECPYREECGEEGIEE